jgi:hypothetical protein
MSTFPAAAPLSRHAGGQGKVMLILPAVGMGSPTPVACHIISTKFDKANTTKDATTTSEYSFAAGGTYESDDVTGFVMSGSFTCFSYKKADFDDEALFLLAVKLTDLYIIRHSNDEASSPTYKGFHFPLATIEKIDFSELSATNTQMYTVNWKSNGAWTYGPTPPFVLPY